MAAPTKRGRVCIDEPNQYLRHNPATDWTKTMTSGTSFRFAENVVPQRSFAMATRRSDPNLLGGEGSHSDVAGNRLAGW